MFIVLTGVTYTMLVGVRTAYSTMCVVGFIDNDMIWTICPLTSTISPGLNMYLELFEEPEDIVLVICYDRLDDIASDLLFVAREEVSQCNSVIADDCNTGNAALVFAAVLDM